MQFISVEYAKQLLSAQQLSLLDAAYQTGLSGTSRLHDLFINIEGMTPGEYKNGGRALVINYSFNHSPFGEMLVASTTKGICHISFVEGQLVALHNLKSNFCNAIFEHKQDSFQRDVMAALNGDWRGVNAASTKIQLHLKGTAFQLKVWQALLNIPLGSLSTYGVIASNIGNANAARAVGTAIGHNPVALIVPCHRVIQATGKLGGYRWGSTRKTAIVGWEGVTSSDACKGFI
ncbi:MAG: O-6-methylguanine DNA methyltransferase [Osedax symbiont Rs2]|nr:MAG: O-6-methylguanine DNA methyltransferase [Osedax symbiont Rs2]